VVGPALDLKVTSSVSGNAIGHSFFRILLLNCYARSMLARWRPLMSAGIVTQLVTRLRVRDRSALQVPGPAAAALDLLPCGAEHAASGESCRQANREITGDGVNAALHDRVAAFGAATILGYLTKLLERHLSPCVALRSVSKVTGCNPARSVHDGLASSGKSDPQPRRSLHAGVKLPLPDQSWFARRLATAQCPWFLPGAGTRLARGRYR
jgi:hypothetical protein